MTNEIHWVLLAFEKQGEKLLCQYRLENLDLATVRKTLGKPEGDPLHGCLKIPEAQLTYFEVCLGRVLDKTQTEYCLECQAAGDEMA